MKARLNTKLLQHFTRVVVLLLPFTSGSGQMSSNLAQQGWYADPEIHIFAGQYWIYPTSSDDAPHTSAIEGLTATQQALRERQGVPRAYLQQSFLDAFSSDDLVHWTKHAHVLDIKNVAWAGYAVWAPSAIEIGGKYYLLFGANDIQKSGNEVGGIGLAVSDTPEGPFVDAIGKPLIAEFHNGAQPIDPFAFRDDDGQVYLYYGGQGHCNAARLDKDLRQVRPFADGQRYKEITPANYVEGPFLIKRQGTYYFMWSEGGWGDASYRVSYAKSDSPTGPFTQARKILETDPAVATGPGHHSVLHIPGTDEWYIAYHRHPLGSTGPNQRVLAIDRLYFNANGDILPVKMTPNGVSARPLSSKR